MASPALGRGHSIGCHRRAPAVRGECALGVTLCHWLVLPAEANHHGTLYAGSLLRLALEAGYATAWKHVGPRPTSCCAGC